MASPLASALVIRCSFVQMRTGTLKKSWTRVLAVATHPGFFHLFALGQATGSEPQPVHVPDRALELAICPLLASPGASIPDLKSSGGSSHTQRPEDSAFTAPLISLSMTHMTMELKPKLHADRLAFELLEVTRAKLWGDKKRSLVLRAEDQTDLADWSACFREHCPLHYTV